MPPVNPQGSRGGLVAAVVVFTVLFVVATIFAIYYGVQNTHAEETNAALLTKYRGVAQDLQSPEVQELVTQAKQDAGKLTEATALAEAISQRDQLRKLVMGDKPFVAPAGDTSDAATPTAFSETMTNAQKAVTAANAVPGAGGAKMTATNLVDAVRDLSNMVATLSGVASQAVKDRDAARQQAARDEDAARATQASSSNAVAKANAAAQTAIDTANDAVKKAEDELASVKKSFDDENHASTAALEAGDKRYADAVNQIETLKKQVTGLADKLAGKRVDVMDPLVRRPEGKIAELGDSSTVYINLGKGDHIVPGMTFEVYDAAAPLPRLGDGLSDENLPKGKASIEVMKVLTNGSECHISRVTSGQQVLAGDPIMNMIYDRNVQPNFVVYGDFDINHSGHPTPAGADVIRRLIVQFGGKLQRGIDSQTDFVVVGDPPEIPTYSADDLKDPLKAQDMNSAQRAAKDYETVLQDAAKLNVPIFNQDKFLYFVGFYDVAMR